MEGGYSDNGKGLLWQLKNLKYFNYVDKATLTMGRGYSDNWKINILTMSKRLLWQLCVYQNLGVYELSFLHLTHPFLSKPNLILPPPYDRKRADKWGIKVQPS